MSEQTPAPKKTLDLLKMRNDQVQALAAFNQSIAAIASTINANQDGRVRELLIAHLKHQLDCFPPAEQT